MPKQHLSFVNLQRHKNRNMNNILKIIFAILVLSSCAAEEEEKIEQSFDLGSKIIDTKNLDSLDQGKSYLPIYSHIYHRYENRTFDLTVTASIRNVSVTDTIYLLKADYYNTNGDKVRQYIQKPI